MREYRLARSWRVITYSICVVFILFAGCLLYVPVTAPFAYYYVFYIIGSFALLFLVYYMYRDTRSGKFIITGEDVKLISPFGQLQPWHGDSNQLPRRPVNTGQFHHSYRK